MAVVNLLLILFSSSKTCMDDASYDICELDRLEFESYILDAIGD